MTKTYYPKTITNRYVALLFILIAVLYFFLEGRQKYMVFPFLVLAASYEYRYRSFSKRGYIKITDLYLTINYGNSRGVKRIDFENIKEVLTKKNNYVIILKNNKKRHIYLSNIKKSDHSSFKEDIKSIEQIIKGNNA